MLTLPYFGLLMQRADSLGRKDQRQREQGVAKDETVSKLWEAVEDRGACHAAVYEAAESDTNQQLIQRLL